MRHLRVPPQHRHIATAGQYFADGCAVFGYLQVSVARGGCGRPSLDCQNQLGCVDLLSHGSCPRLLGKITRATRNPRQPPLQLDLCTICQPQCQWGMLRCAVTPLRRGLCRIRRGGARGGFRANRILFLHPQLYRKTLITVLECVLCYTCCRYSRSFRGLELSPRSLFPLNINACRRRAGMAERRCGLRPTKWATMQPRRRLNRPHSSDKKLLI